MDSGLYNVFASLMPKVMESEYTIDVIWFYTHNSRNTPRKEKSFFYKSQHIYTLLLSIHTTNYPHPPNTNPFDSRYFATIPSYIEDHTFDFYMTIHHKS